MLDKWRGLALPDKTLFQLMLVGKLLDKKECNFYKFLAIACGFLGKVRGKKILLKYLYYSKHPK